MIAQQKGESNLDFIAACDRLHAGMTFHIDRVIASGIRTGKMSSIKANLNCQIDCLVAVCNTLKGGTK